jgi:hypothetical protein
VWQFFFPEKDVKAIDVTRSCLYMMALTGRNKGIGTKKKVLPNHVGHKKWYLASCFMTMINELL